MTQLNPFNIFPKVFIVSAVFALAGCNAGSLLPMVPEDWHLLPEKTDHTPLLGTPEQEALLGNHVDGMIRINGEALETMKVAEINPQLPANGSVPGDWVPWHLEYLMTDFALSASGVLGPLIMKGTPTIMANWRKQYDRKAPVNPEKLYEAPLQGDLVINEAQTGDEVADQLEPSIRAAVKSGRVQNEPALRKNLIQVASEFRELAVELAKTPEGEWWVSRLRVDLIADAQGNVTPNIAVGGEARFRFEWFRMMHSRSAGAPHLSGVAPVRVNPEVDQFVRGMIHDLHEVAVESDKFVDTGFKAYMFRVGVGFTDAMKLDLAIAKATGSLYGQIYFNRDVKKPTQNPKPNLEYSSVLTGDGSEPSDSQSVALVDDAAPSPEQFQMAITSGTSVSASKLAEPGHVVYHLDRSKFRTGLKKATSIGGFFARHLAKAKVGHWKVFEYRNIFDLSFTGKFGLAEVGGLGTSEILYYNTKF